jgi:flagellar protein FlbD
VLKLTRLDQRIVALNPTQVAWVEATPDTMVCMLGGQKIIVRESLDEVVVRFVAFYERIGHAPIALPVSAAPGNADNIEGE